MVTKIFCKIGSLIFKQNLDSSSQFFDKEGNSNTIKRFIL